MVCVVVVVRGNNLDRDVDVVAAWLSPFLLEKSPVGSENYIR